MVRRMRRILVTRGGYRPLTTNKAGLPQPLDRVESCILLRQETWAVWEVRWMMISWQRGSAVNIHGMLEF